MTDAGLAAIFLERLYAAIGHDNLYSWGRPAGISDGLLQTIKRGSIPKAEGLLAISEATGRSIDWLLGREELANGNSPAIAPRGPNDTSSEFVYVPRYDVKASAGTGFWLGDESKSRFTMAFRRHWVEHYLHANPKDLSVLRVHGDSMYPVLHEGDNILINHAQTTPQDGIYVLRLDGQILVKRLQWIGSATVRVISANPEYPPYEVSLSSPEDQREFNIIGRVVWYGRQL
ncbi:S24 family peptidase [Burkholderia ubonensis]|uniref:LexA family transcriptional regulator n=1 Tax=Burkholderia ubonensis TaxID=101571 RepID=UPI000ABDF5F3|nr:helix-turn-helix transcriptional regulator [Burkholderia ubonensis]